MFSITRKLNKVMDRYNYPEVEDMSEFMDELFYLYKDNIEELNSLGVNEPTRYNINKITTGLLKSAGLEINDNNRIKAETALMMIILNYVIEQKHNDTEVEVDLSWLSRVNTYSIDSYVERLVIDYNVLNVAEIAEIFRHIDIDMICESLSVLSVMVDDITFVALSRLIKASIIHSYVREKLMVDMKNEFNWIPFANMPKPYRHTISVYESNEDSSDGELHSLILSSIEDTIYKLLTTKEDTEEDTEVDRKLHPLMLQHYKNLVGHTIDITEVHTRSEIVASLNIDYEKLLTGLNILDRYDEIKGLAENVVNRYLEIVPEDVTIAGDLFKFYLLRTIIYINDVGFKLFDSILKDTNHCLLDTTDGLYTLVKHDDKYYIYKDDETYVVDRDTSILDLPKAIYRLDHIHHIYTVENGELINKYELKANFL